MNHVSDERSGQIFSDNVGITLDFSSYKDFNFLHSDSIAETARKAKKSTNRHGSPIQLPSKILAIIPDPTASNRVYVAEAAGTARRVDLDVGADPHFSHISSFRLLPNVLYFVKHN